MTLKAILFDFNGIIINDEPIHQELIDQILIGENLRPSDQEYRKLCLGRSDRACLSDILSNRGRVVSPEYLDKLIKHKTKAYQQKLSQLETLPIYSDIPEFLEQIKSRNLLIGLVTGAVREDVEFVLDRANIRSYFQVIVTADEIMGSKPDPEGYLLALEKFQILYPQMQLKASNCLAIEDTFAGIEAAKKAQMQVAAVANTYPFHMLQRQANWTVDYLSELELERVDQVLT